MKPEVKAWPPTRYSAPLSENFPSDGDWLLKLVKVAYRLPNGDPIELDDWQERLIRHILEVYPEGHPKAGQLRYRQAFVSVGRQNGKSVLGAIFALYGLVREAGALVIGIASSADQANIVYQRVLTALKSHPSLSKRFQKLTETRGISSTDNSRYLIKASKSSAVQGLDLSLGIVDELHITPRALWSDMVSGTAARSNGIVIGLTTAGDETSELLTDLYDKTHNPAERFGYFIWEAPEDRLPESDEELGRYLQAASPALAEGRLDLETAISDVRSLPTPDAIRYRLNRFVGAKQAFLSPAQWKTLTGETRIDRPVFALDMSPDRAWCTVTAAQTHDDDTVHLRVVACLHNPSVERLVDLCRTLAQHRPAAYVVNRATLGTLGARLKQSGYTVEFAGSGDEIQASSLLFALIAQKRLVHDGHSIFTDQLRGAIRKNVGDRWKLSKADSANSIDALYSAAFACLYSEVHRTPLIQLF